VRAKGQRGLCLLVFIWVFFTVANVTAGERDSDLRMQGADSELTALQKALREMEDANAMLMENLANCTEENEALTARLARCGGKVRTPEKDRLVRELRKTLDVRWSDMAFLTGLREDELRFLLKAVRERISAGGRVD